MTAWRVVGAVLAIYGVASVATFVVYALDKRAARRARWRVPERTLHLFELLGGWPGAMVAQKTLRHKTVDASFRLVFWIIVALHVVGWAALAWVLAQ
jgi:uncharacterized membrane protein YsdA (DUF1294 family)